MREHQILWKKNEQMKSNCEIWIDYVSISLNILTCRLRNWRSAVFKHPIKVFTCPRDGIMCSLPAGSAWGWDGDGGVEASGSVLGLCLSLGIWVFG